MSRKFLLITVAGFLLVAFMLEWNALSKGRELVFKVDNAQPMQRQALLQPSLPGDDLPVPQSTLGIQGVAAFVVDEVLPGSPADKGGLKRGDLITWVNGSAVNSVTDVLQISRKPPGHKVELFVLRHNPNSQQRDPITLNFETAPLKVKE